jgi:hypothetical protein
MDQILTGLRRAFCGYTTAYERDLQREEVGCCPIGREMLTHPFTKAAFMVGGTISAATATAPLWAPVAFPSAVLDLSSVACGSCGSVGAIFGTIGGCGGYFVAEGTDKWAQAGMMRAQDGINRQGH